LRETRLGVNLFGNVSNFISSRVALKTNIILNTSLFKKIIDQTYINSI